jgi:hypothetical protein
MARKLRQASHSAGILVSHACNTAKLTAILGPLGKALPVTLAIRCWFAATACGLLLVTARLAMAAQQTQDDRTNIGGMITDYGWIAIVVIAAAALWYFLRRDRTSV